jgi:hypothetical protein
MGKKCRRWGSAESLPSIFNALFLRQHLVTPDHAVESFGTPAYDEIITHFAGDQPGSEEIPALS